MNYICYDHILNIVRIVIPILILWFVIFPRFIFIKLYSNRNRLDRFKFLFKFGYFYNNYKHKYFYWEFVKMYTTLLIFAVS